MLSGCGDFLYCCEISKELVNLRYAHLGGITFVVIKDVFPDPGNIGFFGAVGVMFETERIAILVKEFFGGVVLSFIAYSVARL